MKKYPMKLASLASLAFGAAVVALVLLLPALGPDPDPPASVARITLQPSPGGEERGTKRSDPVSYDRPGLRSRRGDPRPRAKERPARKSAATPAARSISRANSVAPADGSPPGKLPSNDSPAARSRPDSPASDRSPAPREVPVRGVPKAPEASPSLNDPAPAGTEPADPPDEPVDEDPITASVDPITASDDPADEPDPVGGDPAEQVP